MKILLNLITLLISVNFVFSQDTIYLDSDKKKTIKNKALYFKLNNKNENIKRIYNLNGNLKYETIYKTNKKKKPIKYSVWYDSGELYIESNYNHKKKERTRVVYWKDGKVKRKDAHKKRKLLHGTCWNQSGEKIQYFPFEVQPKFPGGHEELVKYISRNMRLIDGKTVIKVKFYIDSLGNVLEPVLSKSSGDIGIDSYLINLILSMPKWTPAKQDNVPVGVWRTLPVRL